MRTKKIKGFQKYYIHEEGYISKLYCGKQVIVPIKVVKTVPKVLLGNRNYNFVFLMIEYFGEQSISYEEQSQYRFKYKLQDGKIPLSSINLIRYNSNKYDNPKMFTFKCKEKATSANSRVYNISTISESDVFDSLLRMDFKCTYCNQKLDSKTWELDHVEPISKGGLNISTNITPSCKKCNRMKSDINPMDFIHKCKMIALNYSDSEFLNEETFKEKTL
jgi:5-methylcytosine-specific restriction endonuclease McrA